MYLTTSLHTQDGTVLYSNHPSTVSGINVPLSDCSGPGQCSQCGDQSTVCVISLSVPRRKENFVFFKTSRPALRPTYTPSQVYRLLLQRKQSRPNIMRLRMSGAIPLLLYVPSWCGQRELYLYIVRFVYKYIFGSRLVFLAIVLMTKVSMKTLPYVTAQVSMFPCVTYSCLL